MRNATVSTAMLERRKAIVGALEALMNLADVDDPDVGQILARAAEQIDTTDKKDEDDEEEDPFWVLPPPDRHLVIWASTRWEEDYDSGGDDQEMCAELYLFMDREHVDALIDRAKRKINNNDQLMSFRWCVDATITARWSETKDGQDYGCSTDLVPMIEDAVKDATALESESETP